MRSSISRFVLGVLTCIMVLAVISVTTHGARAGPIDPTRTVANTANPIFEINLCGDNTCISITNSAFDAGVAIATLASNTLAITAEHTTGISVGTSSPGVRDDDNRILGIPEKSGSADRARSTRLQTSSTAGSMNRANSFNDNLWARGNAYTTWATLGLLRA